MAHSIEELKVPIAALRPYPQNPRLGDVEAIKRSLQRNGQYRAIVVNRRTMEVLAGNHTVRAAEGLGWREIAATFVEVDDEQARRIMLVDNRTSDLAGYDLEGLAELLSELPDLDGTGYDRRALDALLDELGRAQELEEEDAPPSPPARAHEPAG
jgi:ParB-like chromosome segregation protein Spo0J